METVQGLFLEFSAPGTPGAHTVLFNDKAVFRALQPDAWKSPLGGGHSYMLQTYDC